LNNNYKKKLITFLNRFSRKNRQRETVIALKKRIHMLELTQSRTENYLNNIIRVIPANIYWKDLNYVILGGNLAHAIHAGFSDPKQVIGKTEHDFVWKGQAEEIINNDRLIIESGIGRQLEEEATLSDGKLHTFLTCKDPLRDKDNKIIGIIGVSTDITDFKDLQNELTQAKTLAAEVAACASDLKAATEEEMRKTVMILVGDIVHDLRSPITMIKVVADILESLLPNVLEIVEEAKSLGSTKINLLNQSNLDFLRNKTPIICIQNSIVMMNEFINTTLAELANAHRAASSELTRDDLTQNSSSRVIHNTLRAYPFTTDERNKIKQNTTYDFHFMGNSILLMKVLFNLIKNAFQQIVLNGKGEVIIFTEKGEDYNLIRVKDTAGGAPPEVVAHFFKGYFTTKKNGTGIGLAFCKKTMNSFGGNIVCNSVYGESMEFILQFPACYLDKCNKKGENYAQLTPDESLI